MGKITGLAKARKRKVSSMDYFKYLLSSQAHKLYFPKDCRDDVHRFVGRDQKGGSSPEHAPFRRQLDFWAFSIVTAIARGLRPLDDPVAKWGAPFTDTKSVEMPSGLCELLAVVAFSILGAEHEDLDDPSMIVNIGNRLAGAGCPVVIKVLSSPDLSTTTLDKILNFANSLRLEVSQN